MSNRVVLATAGLTIAALSAIVWLRPREDPSPITEEPQSTAAEQAAPAATTTAPPGFAGAGTTTRPADIASSMLSVPQDKEVEAFKLDASGKIIADEEARLNLETLIASSSPAELQAKLTELSAKLPAAAAQQLAQLVENYTRYQSALEQAYPSGAAPATEQDALAIVEAMHALRVQSFGAETAEGLFGAEEKMQRELLQLMSLERDQNMTLEEKALEAQSLYQSLPEASAIEQQDR